MGFSQALSGLNAASGNLNTISNNIANSQTVGFKSSRTLFSDVYAGAQVGLGVSVSKVLQNFKDGNLENTDRNLDLAISGGGFFRFIQNGQVTYSRNGQLTMTADGYLINAQGGRVTGFPAGSGAGGTPSEIQIPASGQPAKVTTSVAATMNLDASASLPATTPFNSADPKTYSYATSATVFDSLGTSHSMTQYFVKTATSNTWEVYAALDGTVPAGQTPLTLTFDSNGVLSASEQPVGTATAIQGSGAFAYTLTNGAANLNITLGLAGSTQFSSDFTQGSLTQDGHTAGTLVGISIDKSGNVIGTYSNEQTDTLATLAMASFRNPEGLKPVSGNGWLETTESGQPLVGTAGTGQFGSVQAGVVETSNVDLTQELVNLIVAQRAYQANSQAVKTQSEVLQQAVNLGN